MSALNARPKPQISALSPALAISLNASASSADTRGNPASMRPTPSSSRARAISNFCDGVKTTPDRKSTRLNSSHSQISYAVFCLKKKKKQHGHTYIAKDQACTTTRTHSPPCRTFRLDVTNHHDHTLISSPRDPRESSTPWTTDCT